MALDRNGILALTKPQITTVEVKDVGEITIRKLTAVELGGFTQKIGDTFDPELYAEVIANGLLNADGSQMFTVSDTEAITRMPSHQLTAITTAILTHSRGKSFSDSVKNSEETTNDG